MRKTLGRLLLLPAVIAVAGCQPVYAPLMGALYMEVKGPITATESAAATKEGKACARSYLGMVALGDSSIQAAKAAGGITQVSSVPEGGVFRGGRHLPGSQERSRQSSTPVACSAVRAPARSPGETTILSPRV